MSRFDRTPEFDKDFKRLSKKYRSLDDDLLLLETLLEKFPKGTGSKFAVLHEAEDVVIVKARLACRALRESSLHIIYAYHAGTITFVYIELYYKGDKANEDFERIKEYLASRLLIN